MMVSTYVLTKKWVHFWSCSIHSGGFLKYAVYKRVKIHETPFIELTCQTLKRFMFPVGIPVFTTCCAPQTECTLAQPRKTLVVCAPMEFKPHCWPILWMEVCYHSLLVGLGLGLGVGGGGGSRVGYGKASGISMGLMWACFGDSIPFFFFFF